MKKYIGIVLAICLGLVFFAGRGAQAATTVVGRWDFNEMSGPALDSSGNGFSMTVGAGCPTGSTTCATRTTYQGNTILRTPWIANHSAPPKVLGRVSTVPHNPKLNPASGDFAVTMRVRQTQNYGNLIQKGQSGTPGGYFKWEMPAGKLTCLFRDANNVNLAVNSGNYKNANGTWRTLNDKAFHVIKCSITRLSGGRARAEMWIDGVRISTGTKVFGSIANDWPVAVSGKYQCNQTSITCDFFAGDIDYVQIDGNATAATTAVVPSVDTMTMEQLVLNSE